MVFGKQAAVAAGIVFGLSGAVQAAEQYQAMAFGDPGLPGDGVYATAADARLDLATPFSLDGAPGGVTITAFAEPSAAFTLGQPYDRLGVAFVPRGDGSCTVGTSYPYSELVTVNGAIGVVTTITAEQLRFIADHTRHCITGPYTLDELTIQFVNVRTSNPDGSEDFVLTLDALSIAFLPPTDVTVTLSQDKPVVMGGETVTYTVQVSNQSALSAEGVSVALGAHPGGTIVSYSAPGWACDAGTNACSLAGDLAGGAAASFSFEYRTPDAEEVISTTAAVTSATPDPDTSNNSSTISTDVRQCTEADYSGSTVTPTVNTNGNKILLKATVDSGDCGSKDAKVMLN